VILLIGGTGQVGLRVAKLLQSSQDVRALAHSDASTRALEQLGIETVRGDLGEPKTLAPAVAGVDTLFLLTPFSPAQLEHEQNALDAAGELRRVVKLSAINDGGIAIGKAHEAIGRRLAEREIEVTLLRPDFFVSNLLAQLDLIRSGQLIYPAGEARRTFVDPGDVAKVAVAELTAESPVGGELILTGPESLGFADLAARIAAILGREVEFVDAPASAWREGLLGAGVPEFYADALVELFEGDIKPTGTVAPSGDVERVLGRPPHPVDRFIRDELATALA
jgi:uncharacterized protein YbjT (DUF2867 family)